MNPKVHLTEGESDLIWHTAIRSDLDDTTRRQQLEADVESIIAKRLSVRVMTARPPHPSTMAGRK